MNDARRERFSQVLRIGEPCVDALGLCAITGLFLSYLPRELLGPNPATGGDTGSHYWPLVTLVQQALPSFKLRVWNPGNLGGEPHLVHYFPFPYLVMAALSLFVELGTAFNVGTILPLLLLPLSVYLCVRLLGFRFPAPLLAAAASLPMLYNESFVMWGGNTLSTLAGQFAHGYALNLLLLGGGLLSLEIRRRWPPFLSALAFAATATSHAYVLLGIPFLLLAVVLSYHVSSIRERLAYATLSGGLMTLLSLWFLVPLVDNSPWTTAFYFHWISEDFMAEAFPRIFYPGTIVLAGSMVAAWFLQGARRRLLSALGVWLVPTAAYLVYFFVFPSLGLPDIRAIPQIQLFLCILAGTLLGICLGRSRAASFLLALPLVAASIYWANEHVRNFPGWARWNYSSWNVKDAYPDLVRLSDRLRGDFSMPRVVYEHSMMNGEAGTERVFEMLPYFANRATLESVYMQASILAPAAFLVQSEISLKPSCPYVQYECKPYDLGKAESRLRLMGVGEIIFVTPELTRQAFMTPYLRGAGQYGQWTLFALDNPPGLVDVFREKPRLLSDPYWKDRYTRRAHPLPGGIPAPGPSRVPVDLADWKDAFYAWLFDWDGEVPMMIAERNLSPRDLDLLRSDERFDPVWGNEEECKATVKVDFDTIVLETPCPGRAHYLKFAYHSAWRADSGDPLYLVSPGFIGIVPTRSSVTLTWGRVDRWHVAGIVSALTLLGMGVLGIFFWRRRATGGGCLGSETVVARAADD